MKLELAIVLSCTDAGCRVRCVESDTTLDAVFSGAVRDSIRIRRAELVAIDRAAEPPEIAWRWMRGHVDSIAEGRAVVMRLDGDAIPLGDTPVLAGGLDRLPLAPAVGDTVFYHNPAGAAEREVADVAAGGSPAHPAFVAGEYFPIIERAYAGG